MERDGCDGGKAKARGERERERGEESEKETATDALVQPRRVSRTRIHAHTSASKYNAHRVARDEREHDTARANEYDEYTDDGLLSSGCRVHSWRSLARMHAAASSVHTARTRDVAASLDLDLLS